MEILENLLMKIFEMLNEMSPYLLLGFLIAGIMHAFVPKNLYSNYLSKNNFSSVLNAALFGIPLPLCSCGVIPTAMGLRKEGASKGATTSFLIATPQTGVDSILATYSLLGLPFAIIRPLAAFVTSLFGGSLVNIFCKNEKEENAQNTPKEENSCCHSQKEETPSFTLAAQNFNPNQELSFTFAPQNLQKEEKKSCCCHSHEEEKEEEKSCCCHSLEEEQAKTFAQKCKSALKYAFGEMMQDIGKWLIIGIVVAGIISLIPSEYFAIFSGNTLLSMLFVLLLAIPMYLCATGSIPIAVALILKGLTPGAALVMLMAGPACNIASILVIGKKLGRKTLITYLSSIVISAIAFGCLIDFVLPSEWFSLIGANVQDSCHSSEHHAGLFSVICSVVLIILLIKAFASKKKSCCH